LKKASNKYEFRIQCLVKNIDDMKNDNWNTRIKKEKVKKLDEIKQDYRENNNINFNPLIQEGIPPFNSKTQSSKQNCFHNNNNYKKKKYK